MSASKKKQQRKAEVDVEKVTQAQEEQAAYKKKARLYSVIAIVVVVLVAALLIWNSGIFQKNATAATIGDEKISVAELSYFYYNDYYRYLYSMYGISDDDVLDETAGTTYRDYYLERALANAQYTQSLYEEALSNGYSAADVKDSVDEEIASVKASAATSGYSYKAYLKASLGRYMTPSVYKDIITRYMLADLYYSDKQVELENSFTTEDVNAYYADNADSIDIFTYSYLYFTPETVETTDAEGNELSEDEVAALEEAAMEAAKAKAEATLESYNSGVSIADLIQAGEPSTSADHTTAAGSNSIGSTIREALLQLDIDAGTVVESEGYGYYVVIYHGRERSELLSANVRHILFNAETTTDDDGNTVAPTDEAWAAALAEAEAALAEFKAGQQTAEAFGELANKYSDDTGSNTTGGLYEGVMSGDFVTEFNDWMFGDVQPAVGETAVIRHEGSTSSSSAYWGYHVTYMESYGEAEWMVTAREAMLSEALTEWNEALTEAYPAELASGAKHVG